MQSQSNRPGKRYVAVTLIVNLKPQRIAIIQVIVKHLMKFGSFARNSRRALRFYTEIWMGKKFSQESTFTTIQK